jgi:hypothetical protein
MTIAFRQSKLGLPWLPWTTFGGFVVGYILLIEFLKIFSLGVQPATIYLLPCMLLGFCLGTGSWKRLVNIYKS